MKTRLLQPGEAPRAMTWTNRHPNQASRAGVVLFRHSDVVLSGEDFRAVVAAGGHIETTHVERIQRALGVVEGVVEWVEQGA